MIEGFGTQAQQRLLDSSALIIGLGGLGAPVATYLVSSGVGRIGLCDKDTVSLTNLQRQILYTENDLDLPKIQCAHKRLSALSSHTVFDLYPDGITDENADQIVAGYDIVLDCTDNFATRRLIDRTCTRLGKPWVHGCIDQFYGYLTVFNYHNKKHYADLYPEADSLADPAGRIIGTVGPVPGVIGSLQAIEAIKLLSGVGECLDGRLLMLDFATMTANNIEF